MTTYLLILLGIFFCNAVQSRESDSGEVNRIEVTPLYDTIIFSDVADIINEFENNMNPLDALINSGSESEENIEDLLSEYQHYLDKAHKQRINYIEKTKTKNKVPLIRHERYSKMKPAMGVKYDDNYYSNPFYNPNKMPQAQAFNNPLDLFIPISPKLRFINKPDITTPQPRDSRDDMPAFEKRLIELPSGISKLRQDPIKPCFCKNGQYPCDCKCKQCFLPFDSMPQNYVQRTKILSPDGESKPLLPNSEYMAGDATDNTLNIRIKVDIQLPKMQDVAGKIYKNRSREDDNSRESALSSLNLPFPYFNFPIPMDLFGYRRSLKYNKHESAPMHKITIHKKKKSRLSNSNKKHRKKVISFHNVNIDTQQSQKVPAAIEENLNITDYNQKLDNLNVTKHTNLKPAPAFTEFIQFNNTDIANKTEEPMTVSTNETQAEDNNNLMVNMSTNIDNGTDEAHKIENSVEADYQKVDSNTPTEKLSNLRKKRDTSTPIPIQTSKSPNIKQTSKNQITKRTLKSPISKQSSKHLTVKHNSKNLTTVSSKNLITHVSKKSMNNHNLTNTENIKSHDTKKADRGLLIDTELLYWPNNTRNQNVTTSKNITTIILDRENKRAKLNMTKETIRHNRTRVLERAIFGDVNWDDVDTVAPVFMSFVGKYIRGVLTFCSQNICHSMKCAEKTCVHRLCAPNDRWNHRGHCAGSNKTDSVASLESIMDLPSNIAFEIVDILQDKMLGKLFGKITLCISSKCISFVASKKNFLKSKCTIKELSKVGHCPNVKNFKIM